MSRDTKIIDERYLDYIRSLPCLIHQSRKPSDPDHLKARGTEEHKRNDYSALPFCRECHTEREQIGDEKFEAKYNVNLWEEVFYLTCDYRFTFREAPESPITESIMVETLRKHPELLVEAFVWSRERNSSLSKVIIEIVQQEISRGGKLYDLLTKPTAVFE